MFVGADVEALRSAALKFDGAADTLTDLFSRLGLDALVLPWTGTDSDQYREEIRSAGQTEGNTLIGVLREQAEILRRNADAQEGVSSSLVGGGSSWPGEFGSLFRDPDRLLPRAETLPFHPFPSLGGHPGEWIDLFQEGYGKIDGLVDLIDKFDLFARTDVLTNMVDLGAKADLPGALDAIGFGIDVFQYVDAFPDQSGWANVQDGVGLAIDGVGIVVPQVGAAKFAWDVGFGAGDAIGSAIDDQFDTSGAFVDSVVARTGEVPDYEGVGGFFNYVGDGFQNAFSPKAWGFR